jgi:disulfide bond formation protein DsbB
MRLYFAWLISLIALFGSFYFSVALEIEPCTLCWVQRLAMFFIALFLGVAIYQDKPKLARYSLPFTLIGALFALYQPFCKSFCTPSTYMPYLSLIAFVLIAILINSKKQ